MNSVISFNFEKTLAVKREQRNFIVTHLASGDTVEIPSSELLGILFKYEGDFFHKFKKFFPGKKIENFVISIEASELIAELLYFNSVDN